MLFRSKNLKSSKRRPAIVVSSMNYSAFKHEVICAMVSTRTASDKYDVCLAGWKEAGLIKPSIVRTGNLQTVDTSILTVLGYLTTEDMQKVREILPLVLFPH